MTTTLDVVMIVHTLFAALWTGGTLIVTGIVVPATRAGLLSGEALLFVRRRFAYLTGVSVLVLLVTGGHLAGTLYTADSLQTSYRGQLVLSMVGLWALLAISLYGGFRRLSGLSSEQSLEPVAAEARPWFLAASVVSLLLLVVAGLL
ncbi:hypothetical protein [Halomarina rubra]|uniref:Copper resistance protein D n=1 Tax=Halomarina rubra TaxID=2071873 RepID=A0ABD6AY63_9EURY|nr:hypothetical protein [Halomarina rubra]